MKKLTLVRVHYSLGYRRLTFSKKANFTPAKDIMLHDENKEGYEVHLTLSDEPNKTVHIFYNMHLSRYEVEINLDAESNTAFRKKDLIMQHVYNYKSCGWECETIAKDIEDFIEYAERISFLKAIK